VATEFIGSIYRDYASKNSSCRLSVAGKPTLPLFSESRYVKPATHYPCSLSVYVQTVQDIETYITPYDKATFLVS